MSKVKSKGEKIQIVAFSTNESDHNPNDLINIYLENNNHTYDQLDIIVTGDISGDGKCDAVDLNNMKLYLLTKLELNKKEFMAADTNFTEKVDAVDLNQMKLYNLTKLDSFLN